MVDETREPGRTGYRNEPSQAAMGGSGPGERTGVRTEHTPGSSGSSGQDAAGKASEMAGQMKSMTEDAAGRAKDAAETGRESAADGLDKMASNVRERAGDGMAGAAMERAADGMGAAAGYLKEHETGEIWDDLERYVREHPMQAVAAAVATGIVVGRVLR
ncbi:MAG: DUF883 C-terminal domain-containing protein [Dehalococcoidia bacterium]